MKKQRPEFKAYISCMFKSFFKPMKKKVIQSKTGEKFVDKGNIHTTLFRLYIIPVWIVLFLTSTYLSVEQVILNFILFVLLCMLISPLRYFITSFNMIIDEKDKEINIREDKWSVLKRVIGVVFQLSLLVIFSVGAFIVASPGDKNIKINEEIRTVKEAYETAYDYVQKKCPEAKLYSFNFEMKGIEEIEKSRPSSFNFKFQNSKQGLFMEGPFRSFNIKIDIMKNEMHVIEYRYRKQIFAMVAIDNPDLEIDITTLLDIIGTFSGAEVNIMLEEDPESIIKVSSGTKEEEEKDNYAPGRNTWRIDIRSERLDRNLSYIVDLNQKSLLKD